MGGGVMILLSNWGRTLFRFDNKRTFREGSRVNFLLKRFQQSDG